MKKKVIAGLEGVYAVESKLSKVNGKKGRLFFCGYDINDLAEHSCFEESAYLLLLGRLPTKSELSSFSRDLVRRRRISPRIMGLIKGLPKRANPMASLRTCVSALAHEDTDELDETVSADVERAKDLIAKLPTIICAIERGRQGKRIVPPKTDLGHAENLLCMLEGKRPHHLHAKIMDVALVLHMDHGLNASTFAARVTISTRSDIYSAVTSAIGTLKGPLHGGANERVMEMLENIGGVEKTREYIRDLLDRHERIMGIGHRVYKVKDPRAIILQTYSKMLSEKGCDPDWYQESVMIEKIMKEEKGLYPNVDFYSASAYHCIGIPTRMFTPLFAASRIVGWCAQVLEQKQDNRLIRPLAFYTGDIDLPYVPIEKRRREDKNGEKAAKANPDAGKKTAKARGR